MKVAKERKAGFTMGGDYLVGQRKKREKQGS